MVGAEILLLLPLAYAIGGIPMGLLLARALGKDDPRTKGSGNIGATNLARTAGKLAGGLTLILDALKGAVAVWIAQEAGAPGGLAAFAGAAAVMGHMFSPWLRLQGGKGVATTLGFLLAAHLPTGLVAIMGWLLTFHRTRMSALAALVGLSVCPLIAFGPARNVFFAMLVLLPFIYWKHRENIRRIRAGTEYVFPRLDEEEEKQPPDDGVEEKKDGG